MRPTLAALVFLSLSSAHAAIDLKGLTHGGTGCPSDGAGIRVHASSTEEGRLIVYTPDLHVNLNDGKPLDRKACNIVLPVHVPEGHRLVIGRPAVFGRESLSGGEFVKATASVFAAGDSGPEVRVELLSNSLRSSSYYRRAGDEKTLGCGQDVNLRAVSTLLARQATSHASGDANVRGIAFNMRLETCE